MPVGPGVCEEWGGSEVCDVALGPGVRDACGPPVGCDVALAPGVWPGVPVRGGVCVGPGVPVGAGVCGVVVDGWPGVRDGCGVPVGPGGTVGFAGVPWRRRWRSPSGSPFPA